MTPSLPSLTPQEKISPGAIESIQEFMRQHNLDWLDTSIPALDGKTPRQAAKIPEMRPVVTRLILTMPDVGGPAGQSVAIDRDALLKEIGLSVRD